MVRVQARAIWNVVLFVSVISVVSGCTFLTHSTRTTSDKNSATPGGQVAVFSSKILVYEPLSNDKIKNEFTISGRTSDMSGNVRIVIFDDVDRVVTTTTMPVSAGYFEGTIMLPPPPSASGSILVTTDTTQTNDFKVKIPIRFSEFTGQAVDIFFSNILKDPEAKNCSDVYPVRREVSTVTAPTMTIRKLLQGVTDQEVAQGFVSNFPETGVVIQSLELRNNIFYADFNKNLESDVSGACRIAALKAQISKTLSQFSTSSSVVVTINGSPSAVFK
jgi:hypothetical protein